MGSNLLSFLFDTLHKRLNNPQNTTYWLPKRLNEMVRPDGGRLLPVKGEGWDLGPITGEAGVTFQRAIQGQWWFAVGKARKGDPALGHHQPIPCPSNPWPRLAMPSVAVFGLDNVWVLSNPKVTEPGGGYRVVLSLQFGRYTGHGGLPGLSPFRVEGQYSLKQCVCSGKATRPGEPPPAACDGWVPDEEIHGLGSFQVNLTDLFVDAEVQIQISGAHTGRTLQVLVDKVSLRGTQAGALPGLKVDALTVETSWKWMSQSIWLPQARRALESEDGRRGLIANLNASLNQQGYREQLAAILSQQFQKMVDDNLGMATPGALPSDAGPPTSNPVDQYLFDRVRLALNDPGSDYFLPRIVCGSDSPPLEPLSIDRLDLGNQSYEGLQLRGLQVIQVLVTGLSNARVPIEQLVFKQAIVDGGIALSALAPAPQVTVTRGGARVTVQLPQPPLTIQGGFSMKVDGSDEPLGGTFTLTTAGANVHCSLSFSGQELTELRIQVERLQLEAPPAATRIDIELDSAFEDIINAIVNQDAVKRQVMQGVNQRLAESLGALSEAATTQARRLIASRLDG